MLTPATRYPGLAKKTHENPASENDGVYRVDQCKYDRSEVYPSPGTPNVFYGFLWTGHHPATVNRTQVVAISPTRWGYRERHTGGQAA